MLLKILGWIIAPFLMISIRWKKMNGFSKAIGLVWCLILSIVLIAVNSDPAVEAQKNETVVIPSNVHQPTTNQAETTNEQWQASYKQIALNEASAYLELYASQSLSDERLSYAVQTLKTQAVNIEGTDKTKFEDLASFVELKIPTGPIQHLIP